MPTIKKALLGISVLLRCNWTWSEGIKKLANKEIVVMSLFCLCVWHRVVFVDRAAALPSLKGQGNILWKYLGHRRRIVWHMTGAKSQLREDTTPKKEKPSAPSVNEKPKPIPVFYYILTNCVWDGLTNKHPYKHSVWLFWVRTHSHVPASVASYLQTTVCFFWNIKSEARGKGKVMVGVERHLACMSVWSFPICCHSLERLEKQQDRSQTTNLSPRLWFRQSESCSV